MGKRDGFEKNSWTEGEKRGWEAGRRKGGGRRRREKDERRREEEEEEPREVGRVRDHLIRSMKKGVG